MNKSEKRRMRHLRARVRGIQDATANVFKPLLTQLHRSNQSLVESHDQAWRLAHDERAFAEGRVRASWRARLRFLFTGEVTCSSF